MSSLEKLCSQDFLRIPSTETVHHACTSMAEKNVGAVLVIEGIKSVGIFSERDVMKRVIVRGLDPMTTPLNRVMTENVLSISQETKPTVAIEVMHRKGIRHLPITNDSGKIVGLINLRILLNYVIKNLALINRNMQEELDQLRFLNL